MVTSSMARMPCNLRHLLALRLSNTLKCAPLKSVGSRFLVLHSCVYSVDERKYSHFYGQRRKKRKGHSVQKIVVLSLLLVATTLEAGGDAVVRAGLHHQTTGVRVLLLLLGGNHVILLKGHSISAA
jgi:hypothetical protein